MVAQLNQQYAAEVEDNHHSTSCTRLLRPAKGKAGQSSVHLTRTTCTAAPFSQGNGRQEAFTVPSTLQGPGTRCTGRLRTHHLDRSATTPVQAILAGQTECCLDSTSRLVDRICEITPLPTTATISAQTPDKAAGLRERIGELERIMASLRTARAHSRSYSRHRRSRTPPASPSRHDLCWYHRRFGDSARQCTPPCTRQSEDSASRL